MVVGIKRRWKGSFVKPAEIFQQRLGSWLEVREKDME
jgi:hypothetical protein